MKTNFEKNIIKKKVCKLCWFENGKHSFECPKYVRQEWRPKLKECDHDWKDTENGAYCFRCGKHKSQPNRKLTNKRPTLKQAKAFVDLINPPQPKECPSGQHWRLDDKEPKCKCQPKQKCICPFPEETAREIGHLLTCPKAKGYKTWWQEKEQPKQECPKRILTYKKDRIVIGAMHQYLHKHYGDPKECENPYCDHKSKFFDYCLKKGRKYSKDINDYLRLCRGCHRKYDWTPEKTRQAIKNLMWFGKENDWSCKYKECIDCKKTVFPYRSNGLCQKCYLKFYGIKHADRIKKYNKMYWAKYHR